MSEKITLKVGGYIQVDKDQLILATFNPEDQQLEPINPSSFTAKEIKTAIDDKDVIVLLTSMLDGGLLSKADFEFDIVNIGVDEYNTEDAEI